MKKYTSDYLIVGFNLSQDEWSKVDRIQFLFCQFKIPNEDDKKLEKTWINTTRTSNTGATQPNGILTWKEGTTIKGLQIPFTQEDTALFISGQKFFMDTRIIMYTENAAVSGGVELVIPETNIITLVMNGSLFDEPFTDEAEEAGG